MIYLPLKILGCPLVYLGLGGLVVAMFGVLDPGWARRNRDLVAWVVALWWMALAVFLVAAICSVAAPAPRDEYKDE